MDKQNKEQYEKLFQGLKKAIAEQPVEERNPYIQAVAERLIALENDKAEILSGLGETIKSEEAFYFGIVLLADTVAELISIQKMEEAAKNEKRR